MVCLRGESFTHHINQMKNKLLTKFTIEELRQACINDYAKLCYGDGGTQADETSLEDYKKQVAKMSFDQLVNESWYCEGEEGRRYRTNKSPD